MYYIKSKTYLRLEVYHYFVILYEFALLCTNFGTTYHSIFEKQAFRLSPFLLKRNPSHIDLSQFHHNICPRRFLVKFCHRLLNCFLQACVHFSPPENIYIYIHSDRILLCDTKSCCGSCQPTEDQLNN